MRAKAHWWPVTIGRFPRGKRGLKFIEATLQGSSRRSLPSREAWIEITGFHIYGEGSNSRFPRGKRGLKYVINIIGAYRFTVASLAGSVD